MVQAASSQLVSDIQFTNVRILDVFRQEIVSGDVFVFQGMISAVVFEGEDIGHYRARDVVDGEGKIMVPGFIDAHLHVESTNITPSEYSKLALIRGTTTAIADAHEIANVCGLDGLNFMIEDAKRSPLDFKFMMPSCVPALPWEQAGATIDAATMEDVFRTRPEAFFGLGEMMNLPGVFGADPETLHRIQLAESLPSGICDGHAPLVAGAQLNAYVASGVMADHESTLPEEVFNKVSRGMYAMLREGTCSHDAARLSAALVQNPQLKHRCCFCTDDRSPHDALHIGMVDNAVRVGIESGIDPIDAVIMASLTASELFGLEHGALRERRGSIAPGRRADFLLVKDLSFKGFPAEVYVAGQHVAHEGTLLVDMKDESDAGIAARQVIENSVKLPKLDQGVFEYPFNPAIPAVGITPTNAITEKVVAASEDGLRRIVLVERHGRARDAQLGGAELPDLIGKHIGRGFVKGYDIVDGAVASTIGHDSHNVLIVGDNAADMLKAYELVGQGGFVAVSKGREVARIDLPLGGLMSDRSALEVAAAHDEFERVVRGLGVKEPVDPIMGLIFLSLPVIPEVRITPQGIFDVTTFSYCE